MVENKVLDVNLKGLMMDNVCTNWRAVKKKYDESDPNLPIVGCKRNYLFLWLQSLDNITQKIYQGIFAASTQGL